jgi:hypothetical protein
MSNPFSELFSSTEQQYGLPEGYLERTARVESSFNPSAKNPNSSAGGLFQFIDGTAKQYGLADRYDPMQATDAAARLARDNAAILKRTLGRDPTAGELYLAHQQGAGGAVKLLSNPDAPAESIVGAAAARLNGGAGLTAGQLAQKWTAKIDGAQPAPRGGSPALAYAATRGRDPRANMPAPDAAQTMGQMPMARQPMPDLSNTPDAGLRAMIAQQAGGMDMPQGGGMIERLVGGLGGLGGMRVQQAAPQPVAAPASGGAPDLESLVPRAATDPFALFGPGLARNQQAEAERAGKIALIRELAAIGIDPQRAAGLINTPDGLKLALGQIQQAKVAAADSRAVGLLSGQGGAPAPSSPSAGTSVMNDPVMQGTSSPTRAVATDVLRVLADPNASKTMKDAAEKRYAALLEDDKLTTEQKTHLQARREGFGGGILDMKERVAKAGRAETTINMGGGSDKQVFDNVEKSADAARAAATGLQSIRLARQAVEGGGYFGAGADMKLQLQKIAATIGLGDTEKITNTETFRSAIAPQIAAMMKATVGSTQISNADREFAEKAAGGSISLDQSSITKLLGIMEKANEAIIQKHQSILDRVYPDAEKFARERALFSVEAPRVEAATPAPAAPPMQPPTAPAQPSNVRPDGSSPPTPRGDWQEFGGVRIRRVQ